MQYGIHDEEQRVFAWQSIVGYGLCVVLWAIFSASASSGAQPEVRESQETESEAAEEVGLQGLLPFEVPEGLSDEAFEVLGGNWQTWSEGITEEIYNLYEAEDPLSIADQRQALDRLKKRLDVMKRALADSRYRSLFDPLINLHGSLARRVEIAVAVLDTLQLNPEAVRAARLDAARKQVAATLSDLRRDLNSVRNGTAWLPYVRAAEISKFVDADESDESAISLLQSVQKRLKARDTFKSVSRRKFLSRRSFLAFDESIEGYLTIAQAKMPPLDKKSIREELANLIEALESYEQHKKTEDAGRVKAAFAKLKTMVPDGGDQLSRTLQVHYINYNFRMVASERFLSRLIHEKRVEQSDVRDRVMGANVSGTSRTTADVGIDLKPSSNVAMFDLTLSGVTRSSTTAVASRATIYTSGFHKFLARKEVAFDGERFRTAREATISVDANNTTTGASTNYDGGLFSGYARGRAMQEANARRGQSEAIAAQRIRERVLPEFNREATREIARANQSFGDELNKQLKEAGILPTARSVRTSDTHLSMSSRVMGKGELSGGISNATLQAGNGLTVHLHESLLNNVFDRMNFSGRIMSDEEVRKEIEAYLATLTGRKRKLDKKSKASEEDAGPQNFVFAKQDPIRFRIQDGTLNLIIRSGFQREAKDDIPTQMITLPLSFRVEGNQIAIERGDIRVEPVARLKSTTEQIAYARAIIKRIESSFPSRKRSRELMIKQKGKADLALNITKFKALNGWLTVWAQ